MDGTTLTRQVKSALIGTGAGLAVTALGLDTAVSLSTYGFYLGQYGPYAVIAGLPAFLNMIFATFLMQGRERRVMRYSMLIVGTVTALWLGFLLYQGLYRGLIGSA